VGTIDTVARAADFTASIGVNTHMSYTDGAYANVSNVLADLAYLGISLIRDGMPNPDGGIPYVNQVAAFTSLAASGIRFDLVVEPSLTAIATAVRDIVLLDTGTPGAVYAVEGPNEINNQPVTFDDLAGQSAATAFQAALYTAIAGSPATWGIAVYNFTGGVYPVLLENGTLTQNPGGSYTLTNGQLGFHVTLPPGVSTVTMTYNGTAKHAPGSSLFGTPGQNQQMPVTAGKNGAISYTYDNTSDAPKRLYADFIDYGATYTLTNVQVIASGSAANLATFDPNPSLAGQADDANIHVYPGGGRAIGPAITGNDISAYGSAAPGSRVISETGYSTDPNDANGVSQTVQAQQIINGLLEAYQGGVSNTYLYELLDEKPDQSNANPQMHYGLFTSNNAPKLAAVALHNLTALLADTGAAAATFAPTQIAATIASGNAADHSALFEKADGEYDIALWNDGFAGTTETDQVTIALGASFHQVLIDDIVTGTETSLSDVAQVTITLGADPMLIQIPPNDATAMRFVRPASSEPASFAWAPVLAMPGAVSITAPQPAAGALLTAALDPARMYPASELLAAALHHM
jgi:hypothetical protein